MNFLKIIPLAITLYANPAIAKTTLVYDSMLSLGDFGASTVSYGDLISTDGSVIAGFVYNSGTGGLESYSYTEGEVDSLEGLDSSDLLLYGMSDDGSVIVGDRYSEDYVATGFKYENGVLTSLGTLDPDNIEAESSVYDVSADGSVIVGASDTADSWVAFKYEDGEMISLGTLDPSNSSAGSYALTLSADGSVIIGDSDTATSSAVAYKYEDGVMTSLGTLNPSDNTAHSHVSLISSDGTVIVGDSETSTSDSVAFKYEDGEMISLGTLNPSDSAAESDVNGMSLDGSVIIGDSDSSDGSRAYKYENGVMTNLGVLSGGSSSTASFISGNGDVVVGTSSTSTSGRVAFQYSYGEMVSLGTLDPTDNTSRSTPQAVSFDGSIIVGYSDTATAAREAFKYEDGVMTGLGFLEGGEYSVASEISSDGTVITGYSDSSDGEQAFIYRTEIIDVSNNISSINQSQEELDSFVNLNISSLNRILKQNTQNEFSPYHKFNMSVNSGIDGNSLFKYQYTNLKLSYDFTPHITLGGLIEQDTDSDSDLNIESTSSTPTIALYANFVQNRNASGFELSLSSAYKKEKVHITRNSSVTLSDTEIGVGDSKVYSLGGAAKLAYRFDRGNYSVKPYTQVSATSVRRSGYTENDDIDFPISFNKVSNTLAALSLGSNFTYRVNKKLNTSFDLGVERNIYQNEDKYEAQMDYLGTVSTMSLDENEVQKEIMFLGAGAAYKLNESSSISANYLYRQSDNGESNEDVSSFYMGYNISF